MLMFQKPGLSICIVFLAMQASLQTKTVVNSNENLIIGNWMSLQKNLIINISKEGNRFRAKIVWFNDNDDPSRPMDTRMDSHNPNKELRRRKLIGLEILSDLHFNPRSGRWEDGIIYDPLTGKDWSSVVSLDTADSQLKVKGYWQFEFISKSIAFRKLTSY